MKRVYSLVRPLWRRLHYFVFPAVNVQFRIESFNISNTPNFYIGNSGGGASFCDTAFCDTAFGGVSQTDPNYTPRQYEFALEVQF